MKTARSIFYYIIIFIVLFYIIGIIFHLGYVNPKLKEASIRYSTYDYSVKLSELKNPLFAFGYFFGYTGTGYTYIHLGITLILEFIGIYLWKRDELREKEEKLNDKSNQKNEVEKEISSNDKKVFTSILKPVANAFKKPDEQKSNKKPKYKEAKKKIYELKKLLDDGIINKDEYEKSAAKYKKILLQE